MSNWFTNTIVDSVSGLVSGFGDAIDKNVTSDEERLTLRNEFEKIGTAFKTKIAELESTYQQELTKRWESDNRGSWLAKNVRPLSLVYLLIIISILAITDGNISTFEIKEIWVELFTALAVVAFTAYFGSRGYEKVKGATK